MSDMSKAPDKPGMVDQTNSNMARVGAPKRTQTSFELRTGMKDMTDDKQLKGTSPSSPGFGGAPDASSPNPLDPSPADKVLGTGAIKLAWGMRDAMGDSINGSGPDMASTVLKGGRM